MSYGELNHPGESTPSNDTAHGGYKELFDATLHNQAPESRSYVSWNSPEQAAATEIALRQRAIEQGMIHMGTKPISEDLSSSRPSILDGQVYQPGPSILDDITRQPLE
jgi:hypothetical protein